MDTTSMPPPDLSLHISPPTTTTAPSSMHSSSTDCDLSLDIWKKIESFKNHNEPSSNTANLSLFRPSSTTDAISVDRQWRTFSSQPPLLPRHDDHHHYQHHRSILEAPLDGLRPIKGIPIYHSTGPLPFFPVNNDPNKTNTSSSSNNNLGLGFSSQIPSYPSSWSSSSSSGLSTPNYQRLVTPTMLKTPVHQFNHQYQFGIGSRLVSKLPTKRSMRAPRMRWTSTLHARFVHAVELLGGHESKYANQTLSSFSVQYFNSFRRPRILDRSILYIYLLTHSLIHMYTYIDRF